MKGLNDYRDEAHEQANRSGFYEDTDRLLNFLLDAGRPDLYEIAEQLVIAEKELLIISEVVEMMEARRKGYDSIHYEEEMADANIRLFDLAGRTQADLYGSVEVKMQKNAGRPRKHGRKF